MICYLTYSEAANFTRDIALFVLITVISFLFFGFKSQKKKKPVSLPALLIIFFVGATATAIFWFRAWNGVPGRILADLPLDLFLFAFWWPGVLYATIFRYPGEGIYPSSRKRFIQNTGIGLLAGLVGFIAAYSLYENHHDNAAKLRLFNSIDEIDNKLSENVKLNYQLRDDTIYLNYSWAGPIAETNYEALKIIRQLNAASARLVSIRIPRRVIVEMNITDKRFAHLDWGPGRSGNPWDSLDLDFIAAGVESQPDQSDIAAIIKEEPVSGYLNDFGITMDKRKLVIHWKGDDNILDSATGVIKITDYWNSTNRLITQIRRHFPGVEGYYLQFPSYELNLTARQTYRTMFYAQRFLPHDVTVFLRVGEVFGEWEKPSELNSPLYILRYEKDLQRHHVKEVWPFIPEKINEHKFYLIKTDREGFVRFIVVPEEDISKAKGPFDLHPGESLEMFNIKIENLGRTNTDSQR